MKLLYKLGTLFVNFRQEAITDTEFGDCYVKAEKKPYYALRPKTINYGKSDTCVHCRTDDGRRSLLRFAAVGKFATAARFDTNLSFDEEVVSLSFLTTFSVFEGQPRRVAMQ